MRTSYSVWLWHSISLTQFRQTSNAQKQNSRKSRSRSNTAHSYNERYEDPDPEPIRQSIRSSNNRVPSSSRLDTHREYPDSPARPSWTRAATFEGPITITRESTPVNGVSYSRKPSFTPTNDVAQLRDVAHLRGQLRPTSRINTKTTNGMNNGDLFSDPSDGASTTTANSSPDHYFRERSVSPATSQGSSTGYTQGNSTGYAANGMSNGHGSGAGNGMMGIGKKGPPPPPPSRAKKPPPPPPPMMRAGTSFGAGGRY